VTRTDEGQPREKQPDDGARRPEHRLVLRICLALDTFAYLSGHDGRSKQILDNFETLPDAEKREVLSNLLRMCDGSAIRKCPKKN
jgi:hypothetical protein